MSIIRDSALTFITRIAFFILQGVAALLLARTLGPEGRGLYSLIITLPHITAIICNCGFNLSGVYFISSGLITKNRVLALMTIFPVITGFLAVVPLWFLSGKYVTIYPEVPVDLFRAAIFLIPFIALFNNSISFLQGEKRFEAFNGVNLSNPFFFLVGFITFVVIIKQGITGAIVSWQASFILSFMLGLYFILKTNRFTLKITLSELKKMTRYGTRVAASELLTLLNYRLDIFLVGYFLDAKSVGWYTVAVVIAETLWFLSSSISNVLLPHLSERRTREAQVLLAKAFGFVLWSTVLMVLFLIIFDRLLLTVAFGTQFLQSLKPLRYLYPGVLVLSLHKIISSYILAIGKPTINMVLALGGVLVNIIMNLILIPRFGIAGAAIASSIAYGLMFLAGICWFIRQNEIPGPHYLLIQKEDASQLIGKILKPGGK